jgi:hypothetical protein
MAPPKATTTSTSTPKKPCSKPPTVPVQEETPGASTSEPSSTNFPRDYIPPRKRYKQSQSTCQKMLSTSLWSQEIPPGVIVEEDMLGLIPSLKYADHDITDEKKFLELAPSKYLKRYISAETKMVVIEPEIWATRLQKDGI